MAKTFVTLIDNDSQHPQDNELRELFDRLNPNHYDTRTSPGHPREPMALEIGDYEVRGYTHVRSMLRQLNQTRP